MNEYKNRWTILRYLVVGAFLSPLDYFIVNMALPAIKTSFQATDNQLQMVIAIYGLTYAALVVCSGKLGDIYGRKNIFTLGLWIFLFSSIACGLSPTIQFLIFARFLQGIGASLLAPQVLASIKILFEEQERAKALGFFGSVFGLAAIMGQLLGGVLLELQLGGLTWEIIFFVNVPVAALCLYGIYTNMPAEPLRKQRLDYGGVLLIISTLLCFITPLIYGRTFHWAWWIWGLIGLSFILLTAFIQYERNREKQHKNVVISLRLFHNKAFALHLPIILFYNFTAGLFICYPYYLQTHLQWSVLATGLAIVPYGIGFFLGPILFAKIERSAAFWIPFALTLLCLSFVSLGLFFYNFPTPNFLAHGLFLCAGLGHGLIMPVMMKESILPITVEQAGQASGIISTIIQVGSVLGGAILGTVFFSLSETVGFPIAFAIALATIGTVQLFGISFYLTNKKNKII
ncbi:MFS transporter [Myroides odoratus]|uniref:Spectinomycin tetracycline efflux pump n=1 Tax=Myroides odoratus TaxID=256 RepID=A0A378RKB3_MYROD|nr:MFS transporter [Myroides odoratus]QQU05332.1 MFS transporter [Myroides odoratus]STZ27158.1 Spectinomycin tetracycline efflux pump [Myroides odoratus]